ncbi:MFS transporter [Actinokineospora iranica]|uniref:Drug resistance transporter, EmrB/QacA subfamily n=1 Tax=Actinokineospora iranica TaxID=1271860 RepID=A0A1G6SQU5_9PSEU|nr:MFS transporter [Actinokineospora iranica]SDD18577.1 drug resistance transporter, EmrB/QacA subfamily [Actinokineospora iranica]
MATHAEPVSETVSAPASPARWGMLLVLLSCDFMVTLDFFVANVAIPSIQRDLGAGHAQVQFVVVGYGLAYAAGLITWGRLGDIHGRRRLFALGLGLFTAASVACGLAPTAPLLVLARVAQGLAAGLMAPQVLAILGTGFTGARRARVFAIAGLSKGVAAVFGQLIGGLLIAADAGGLGWRLCFLVNLPIGVAALAMTPRAVPESRSGGSTRLDGRGAVLVALGLVALVLPLVEGRERGWPVWSWVSLALAAALLALCVARQRRLTALGGTPLVDVNLFRDNAFTFGAVITTLFYAAMGAFLLVLAVYLQDGLGLSPVESGLLYTVIGAGFFAMTLCGPAIFARIGSRLVVLGALVLAAGWAALALTATAGVLALLPALLACGLGMGMVMSQLTALTIAAVPARRAGAASGVLNTAVQVGSAVGVALVGIVFYGSLSGGYPGALAASLVGMVALGLVLAALARRLPHPSTATDK